MSEELKAILKTKLGYEPEIKRIVMCQIGGVRYATKECGSPGNDQDQAVGSQSHLKQPQSENLEDPSVRTNVLPALKKHPNVFEASLMLKEEELCHAYARVCDEALIISGPPFYCRIKMPKRLHKYGSIFPFESPVEEFEVISTGSVFYAFADIADYPVWAHFGHEFRVLLRQNIESETKFTCPEFGPSPIHPEVFIVFCCRDAQEAENAQKGPRILTHDKRVLLIIEDNEQDAKDAVFDLMIETESTMCEFYHGQNIRSSLIDKIMEIERSFSDLDQSTRKLANTAWYQFPSASRLTKQARQHLHEIAIARVSKDSTAAHLKTQREHLLQQIRMNPVLSGIESYFVDMTSNEFEPPDSLSEGANYLASELNAHTNKRLLVFASVLGAIAGAVLTCILSNALSRG